MHFSFTIYVGIVYLLVMETLVRLRRIVTTEKRQRSMEKASAAVVPARQQLILQQRWPLQKVIIIYMYVVRNRMIDDL